MAFPDERRHVTVLFADLSDFTPLSERLDPEEVTGLINRYFEAIAGVVDRYEGTVNHFLGDAALVLFGAPVAHEDDPERAVRAALEMMERVAEINRGSPTPVEVHIGINAGLVVAGNVGSSLHKQYTVIGDVVNTAARVQGAAEAGQVLVGESVYRLTRDAFEYKEVGRIEFKGKTEPVAVYEPVRALPRRTRLQVAQQQGLSTFVGRREELAALQGLFATAAAGRARAVGLAGEPGTGKSRLLYEFHRSLADEALYLEGHCVPYGGASAYQPLIGMLRRHWDLPDEVSEEVGQRIAQHLYGLAEYLPSFEDLFSLPPTDQAYLQLSPRQRRAKTFQGLVAFFQQTALSQPLVVAIDDLQWADQTSQEFLAALIDAVASYPVLLVLLSRPEFDPPWADHPSYTKLTLSPLPLSDGRLLVRSLLPYPPSPQLEDYVLGRTEGNPFFTEELLRTLQESGALALDGHNRLVPLAQELGIPDTVQGVIAARIDRLDARPRQVLQVASVIGRQFPVPLLRQVLTNDPQLEQHLARLTDAQFIYPQDPDRTNYLFSHALTHEVAYHTPLRRTQQQTHRQVADALIQVFPHTAATQPETLAHHYTQAQLRDQAIPYWQQAAQRAIQRSANHEAITHVHQALQLLGQLPPTPQHTQQELTLQTTLGVALISTQGYASVEAEQAYSRARQLGADVREPALLAPALRGLWIFHNMRADYEIAQELARDLLAVAEHTEDSGLRLEAHRALGITLLAQGDLASARSHYQQGLRLYDPDRHQDHVHLYGQDPQVACLAQMGWLLSIHGYLDQAIDHAERAIAAAQELGHPFSLAGALFCAAAVYSICRDPLKTEQRAQACIEISTQHQLGFLLAHGRMLLGLALSEQGGGDDALDELKAGLAIYEASGAVWVRPYYEARLAAFLGRLARYEPGLEVVNNAIAHMTAVGERVWESELYRARAELGAQSADGETQAEQDLQHAIHVARQQGAKSFELAASTTLAHLLVEQARYEEARTELAATYNWFTEGFDVPLLRSSRELANQLRE